jgi:hypothetical protein
MTPESINVEKEQPTIYAGDFYEASKADPNLPHAELILEHPHLFELSTLYFDEHYPVMRLAEHYGIGRTTVRRRLKAAVSVLWQKSSTGTQLAYPLERLDYEKPKTPDISFVQAKHRDSLVYRASDLALKGLSAKEIMRQLDINPIQLKHIRKDARNRFNVDIPTLYKKRVSNKELATSLSKEKDPKRVKTLLKQVNKHFYLQALQMDDPPIIKVGSLLTELGIKRTSKAVIELLISRGVPVGRVLNQVDKQTGQNRYYYVITKQFVSKAKEVLKDI